MDRMLIEILLRCEDADALEGMQAKEMIVVGKNETCVSADGEGEKLVVFWIDAGVISICGSIIVTVCHKQR